MSTWHGVMADEEKLSRCKISTDTVYNTFKTHTRYAHIVLGRPTLKAVERFFNESVREPYERSLYERTFMTVNLSSRNMLCQLSYLMLIERNRHKSHRVRRRDREPSRIPIWSLKRLRKNSRKVRKFVDARIISCIPMSFTLNCYVNAKKLLNEKTFKFSCRETKFISNRKPGWTQICV